MIKLPHPFSSFPREQLLYSHYSAIELLRLSKDLNQHLDKESSTNEKTVIPVSHSGETRYANLSMLFQTRSRVELPFLAQQEVYNQISWDKSLQLLPGADPRQVHRQDLYQPY
jgi:hypothetical protein